MIGLWATFLWVIVRTLPPRIDAADPPATHLPTGFLAARILVLLAVVGVSATVAAHALIRIADGAGVPEFLVAYFGAALGTSAPELVVVIAAVRRAVGSERYTTAKHMPLQLRQPERTQNVVTEPGWVSRSPGLVVSSPHGWERTAA